jgi:peroxiredoxin
MTVIENAAPKVGSTAPTFSLPDTEGVAHEPGGAEATVVVFTCNHCPYALAWHGRIVAAARDYEARGVKTLAINSNDSTRYPPDSPEAMRARVEAGELGDVPYLHDRTQEVARAYDAKTTPDVFVLDRNCVIRYRGAPDRDHDDPTEDAAWLRGALDAVLAGGEPHPAETNPVGCTIKWRE